MTSRILLALALLPAFGLMMYVRRLDKIEKEPKELIAQLLIFGALTTISAMLLEWIGGTLVSALVPDEKSVLYLFLEFIFVVAVAEELGKFAVLWLKTWNNPNFNYTYDAIVYAVASSLGFAALENILYVFLNGGVPTAIMRALTAVPAHCMFGVFMGYFYGIAKKAEFWGYRRRMYWNLFLACAVPMLVHGFYDFSVSVEWWGATLLFLLFYVTCIVVAFIRIRKESKADIPIGFYPEKPDPAPEQPPVPQGKPQPFSMSYQRYSPAHVQDQQQLLNGNAQSQQPNPYAGQYQQPNPYAGQYQQPNPYAGQYQQPNPHAGQYQQPNPYAGQYQQPNPYAGQYQQPNPHAGQYQQPNPYAGQYQQPNPYAGQKKPPSSYDSLYRPPADPVPQQEVLPDYLPDPSAPSYSPTPQLPEEDLTGGSMPELPEDVLNRVDLSKFE
ncbi:MAG: PrsW family intramembrane metalloprotease [Oscillospiraceae bacterium]|nr:PrsW family intramembrane metalloprotease [Oscillospiraceae bacterium]